MMNRTSVLALLLATTLPGASIAQPGGSFTVAETGERFQRLQEAVSAIAGGDGTIRIAPGRYAECAVQEAGRIAFMAEQPGTAVFEGTMCEGKGALVLRGAASHVEGLVFRNMSVSDGNGAGIRIEKGDLTVAYTTFADGQCGILSAADPASTISVDHSTFSGLGKHPDGTGAHSLYIGEYGALKVTNTRFERGTGGHYVKTRAPRLEVTGSSFDDSRGRTTNYMIDISAGAVGRIAGNTFVQGAAKENYSTMIAVAPEGTHNRSAGLIVENNVASLAPGANPTVFVGDWSGEGITIRGNRLGNGIETFGRR